MSLLFAYGCLLDPRVLSCLLSPTPAPAATLLPGEFILTLVQYLLAELGVEHINFKHVVLASSNLLANEDVSPDVCVVLQISGERPCLLLPLVRPQTLDVAGAEALVLTLVPPSLADFNVALGLHAAPSISGDVQTAPHVWVTLSKRWPHSRGFENLGNTCYLAALAQALNAMGPFYRWLQVCFASSFIPINVLPYRTAA